MSAEPTTAPVAFPAPVWPRWQLMLFRWLCCYYLLYAFPRPFVLPLQTLGGLTGIQWLGQAAGGLGTWVEHCWEELTTWMDGHGLAPWPVIHQLTGSGDTAHDWARLLANVVFATLLAALWSAIGLLLPRVRAHPHLGRCLHLCVRWDLAFWLFSYGFSKLYHGQFGELELTRLTTEVGDLRPMTMVGTFLQANRPYELFSGWSEVSAGVLLCHRRTALLGACVAIGVMANVCALNWFCGVPVKLFSLHLLLYAVCLLAPFRRPLWSLFVNQRAAPTPVDLAVVSSRWARRSLTAFGAAWVVAALVLSYLNGSRPPSWRKNWEKSELYGLWLVDKMMLDGVEVPSTDASRWRYFAVDRGNSAWAREAGGKRCNLEFTWDAAAGVAQVRERKARPKDDPEPAAEPWTCTLGRKVVPVDVTVLLTNADRMRKVDGERRTLVLTGNWGGKQLELHAVQKLFRLQTGFWLRQELPDGW